MVIRAANGGHQDPALDVGVAYEAHTMDRPDCPCCWQAPAPAAPAIPNGVDGFVLIDEIYTRWSM